MKYIYFVLIILIIQILKIISFVYAQYELLSSLMIEYLLPSKKEER